MAEGPADSILREALARLHGPALNGPQLYNVLNPKIPRKALNRASFKRHKDKGWLIAIDFKRCWLVQT